MKILVTSGATREPIDAVRFLSNVSSGRTGALLADALARHGHSVTLLHGQGAELPEQVKDIEAFSSTADLQARLRRLLGAGAFGAVVHAAAVSDYRPAESGDGKLTSYAASLTLHLVPTPKLLPELKRHAAPRPLKVVGFKLTAGADDAERAQAVTKLFSGGTVDAVIHNDMDDLAAGAARPFTAWTHDRRSARLEGIAAVADWLHAFLSSDAGQA